MDFLCHLSFFVLLLLPLIQMKDITIHIIYESIRFVHKLNGYAQFQRYMRVLSI